MPIHDITYFINLPRELSIYPQHIRQKGRYTDCNLDARCDSLRRGIQKLAVRPCTEYEYQLWCPHRSRIPRQQPRRNLPQYRPPNLPHSLFHRSNHCLRRISPSGKPSTHLCQHCYFHPLKLPKLHLHLNKQQSIMMDCLPNLLASTSNCHIQHRCTRDEACLPQHRVLDQDM